jgi:hypothetical protein
MDQWSKDHWSTLAYVETVMVDCAGFQVGHDGRMKTNRRHFRVMSSECPQPKRPGRSTSAMAVVMRPEHATKIKDGTVIDGHDDWMCVQDMAAEGLFTVGPDDVEPGVVLHFSERGKDIAAALRQHKADGKNFASFEAPALAA